MALAALGLLLAACAPVAAPTPPEPAAEVPEATEPAQATSAPAATQLPAASATPAPQATQPPAFDLTPAPPPTLAPGGGETPAVEERVVELEWPAQMRLGDSDLLRLALVPSGPGYLLTTEFPDHTVVTSTVPVERPGGYDLAAVARLDGAGFEVSPQGDQVLGLPLDLPAVWRWSISPQRGAGRHRLSVSLRLRWTPQPGNPGPPRETHLFSRGLDVQVTSFLGLTRAQAAGAGLAGLAFGGGLSLPLLAYAVRPGRVRAALRAIAPNPSLVIEAPPALQMDAVETALLRALFGQYGRLTLESEFRSGYSGARIFLALPVRPDGRADAHTIAKIGERASIQREYENYLNFVRDRLPPITARIQEAPVALAPAVARLLAGGAGGRAALRYTFIGEPGRAPVSLRETLLAAPDPAWIEKLFETFGPNWWMQRRPHTFRLAQEYDRLLPAHYALEPAEGRPEAALDGRRPPAAQNFEVGSLVTLRSLRVVEQRPDGRLLSLAGRAAPGYPALRARWASLAPPEGAAARVTATRESLLREYARGFDLPPDLPDPLARLPALLDERVIGTQSVVHGDLNVENVLVGPGGLLWLIDFAQTREGHPLLDFAHLEAEIIAHVIAPQLAAPAAVLDLLRVTHHASRITDSASPHADLLRALHAVAARCLFNPSQMREYWLALYLACLGALKYRNLDAPQKHVLFLTAAHLARDL